MQGRYLFQGEPILRLWILSPKNGSEQSLSESLETFSVGYMSHRTLRFVRSFVYVDLPDARAVRY